MWQADDTTGLDLFLSQPEIVAWLDDDAPPEPRVVRASRDTELLVRPLRHGETETVQALFERLGPESRLARFHGPKPRLGEKELRWLAAVSERHRALVAFVAGDSRPVALARLFRFGDSGELAFEVADEYHGRGIGSALTRELLADACSDGVTEVTAVVRIDNDPALAVLRRCLDRLEIRVEGPQLLVRGAPCAPAPAPCA